MVQLDRNSPTYKAINGKEPKSEEPKATVVRQNLAQAMNAFGDFIAMAEHFIEEQPIYYDKYKLWWIWNFKDNKWEICDEVDIMNAVDETLGIMSSTQGQIKAQILESLKRVSRKNKPLKPKKTWIQFKDKIVDVVTSEEFEPTPLYFMTNPIPWKIGETDETPVMDRIFTEWVGMDYKTLLYEIMAYCLLPDYPLHRIFCFLGAGMNGKSCYLELIKRFIGKNNSTCSSLENLIGSKFESAKLHKKLVCFMGETTFSTIKRSDTLKTLSGGDMVSVEYKGKNPFDHHNYAKLIIATNNLPSTKDKTIGWYRRWVIVDFPQQFDEKTDILAQIPEQEYTNLALKCIPLLNGILKKREFTNEGTIEERKQRFEEKSNPLNKFINECVKEDWNLCIYKFEFKEKLDEWCKANAFRQIGNAEIKEGLKEKSKEIRARTGEFDESGIEKRYRAWSGITWKIM